MSVSTVNLTCPGCGAPVAVSTARCPYCRRALVISTLKSIASFSDKEINEKIHNYRSEAESPSEDTGFHKSLGICYLKLRQYDFALKMFEQAALEQYGDPEIYFCIAIALLRGQPPHKANRTKVVNKAIEQLDSACSMFEPSGIYYYFLAYLVYHAYEQRKLRHSPSSREYFSLSQAAGVSRTDIELLFDWLKQPVHIF